MAPSPSSALARTELAAAVEASRIALSTAESHLHRSLVARSRAAEALERTARQPGLDEDERSRRRADYAAAEGAVIARRSEVERARELVRAAEIVADAVESHAASASTLAAALIDVVDTRRGVAPRPRTALAAARRTSSPARFPRTRPRTS